MLFKTNDLGVVSVVLDQSHCVHTAGTQTVFWSLKTLFSYLTLSSTVDVLAFKCSKCKTWCSSLLNLFFFFNWGSIFPQRRCELKMVAWCLNTRPTGMVILYLRYMNICSASYLILLKPERQTNRFWGHRAKPLTRGKILSKTKLNEYVGNINKSLLMLSRWSLFHYNSPWIIFY